MQWKWDVPVLQTRGKPRKLWAYNVVGRVFMVRSGPSYGDPTELPARQASTEAHRMLRDRPVSRRTFRSGEEALRHARRAMEAKCASGYQSVYYTALKNEEKHRRLKAKSLPRGLALVHQCISLLSKRKTKPRPMPESALARVRLPGGKPLPTTLQRFLAFDASFRTLETKTKRFNYSGDLPLGADFRRPRLAPASKDEVVAEAIGTRREGVPPVRARDVLPPAVDKALWLPLPSFGDQLHFLYAGKPDDRGEYPIIGVEAEGWGEDVEVFVWAKYPAFDLYLAHMADAGLPDDFEADIPGYAKELRTTLRLNPALRD